MSYYYYNSSTSSSCYSDGGGSSIEDDNEPVTWHYAVAVGKETGIFNDYWGVVNKLTSGYPGALFKKFEGYEDAERYLYLRGVYVDENDDNDWYYAVAVGRQPGIYTHFADAQDETLGYSGFRMKKFWRFWEAEAYLREFDMVLTSRCAYEDSNGDRYWTAKEKGWNPNDPKDPEAMVAFCDGSALGNGTAYCRAAYAAIFPHCRDWDVVGTLANNGRASNNRAEYTAALMALRRANAQDPDRQQKLFVFSDSELLVNSMTDWVYKWENNGWTTMRGTPVANQDLLARIVNALGDRKVQWIHVLGHSECTTWESHWNNVADTAAREAANRIN